MKKLTKILVVALTFALLVGTVFAFTVSAEETSQPETENKGSWIVSKNVSYEDNTHLYFGIDSAVAADSTKLTLSVLDAQGNVLAEGLTVSVANHDIYNDGSKICHVIKTPGVAAKDFADVLTINVYYDGSAEPVESITYSVAEYFLERLYKNNIINATEGKELSQKKLYKASMRYGAAAQKVLSPDDETKVSDLIYVAGAGTNSIWNSKNSLTIPEGYWKVQSFVGDEIVNSVVDGGNYNVAYSAIISPFSTAYEMPEGSTKVEGFIFGEGETQAPWIYDTENDSVLMGYHNHNKGSELQDFYVAPVVKEEDGEQYINFDKPKGYNSKTEQGAQTSMVWVNNSGATGGTTVTFETKMRVNSISGTTYFRVYTGRTITGPSSGTVFGKDGGRNIGFTGTELYNVTNKTDRVDLGNKVGEWFTIRFVMSGQIVRIYTNDEYGNMVYRGDIDKTTDWNGFDLANVTAMILMNDSDATMNVDVAYSYLGAELPEPGEPKIPVLTTAENSNYKFTDKSATASCSTTATKDILDNSVFVEVEKFATGSQLNLLYQLNSKNTGTSSAFVLEFDMLWSKPKTAGVSFASSEIDITLRDESATRVFRSFFKYQRNNITITVNSGATDKTAFDGDYRDTGLKLGDWFNVKMVYEAVGSSYSADTFKVTIYLNGVEFGSTTQQFIVTNKDGTTTPMYAAACDIYNIGIIANGSAKANLQVKNLEMYFTE